MSTTCPKCAYTRSATDTAPVYECPRCGVIYEKARARSALVPVSRVNAEPRPATARRIHLHIGHKQLLAAALFGCFVSGYFVGREHLKWQIASALGSTAANIKTAFSSSLPGPPTRAAPKLAPHDAPIRPSMLRKGWHEGEYGQSEITFAIAFANGTGKNVRAFDGRLVFSDLLGNEIQSASLAVNDPVGAGQSLEWEGKLRYNQFIASHEALKNAEMQNMSVGFTPKQILFEDGQVKQF